MSELVGSENVLEDMLPVRVEVSHSGLNHRVRG